MSVDKILIVEDDKLMSDFLSETLRMKHIDVLTSTTGSEALKILEKTTVDMVITDMKMSGMSGIELLRKIKELYPNIGVVVVTGFGSIESAVEAMRLGAFHYLIKPFTPETIETVIAKAKEQNLLLEENKYLRRQVGNTHHSVDKVIHDNPIRIIGNSHTLKNILKDVMHIAKSNANVFIHGESGTGKEVIAHAIHYNSLRHDKPFIKMNCAAVPDTLIESEFFGHEKGSFTGADSKRLGRFELAHGGTLLLDEVTEIPLLLQAKLLRVIQEHEFERVGGNKPIKVDARLISTSNRDMKDAVTKKILREDLYYRLNVVPIYLPPLRDRREDILPLAEHFLSKLCIENHKDPASKTFTPESKKLLLEYPWPGNARELANVIERAIVMETGPEIAPEHLRIDNPMADDLNHSTITLPLGISLEELEKRFIIEALHSQQNHTGKTAELLGITPRKLRTKLAAYKLSE